MIYTNVVHQSGTLTVLINTFYTILLNTLNYMLLHHIEVGELAEMSIPENNGNCLRTCTTDVPNERRICVSAMMCCHTRF